jgi:hypothetical protein
VSDFCIHDFFEEQVARTPAATALICEHERVTYAELNERANRLAHYLRKQGVGPEVVGGTNGDPFIGKNFFELKNAQRVLLDGNLMENNWGGFSQVGFAILITTKNHAGGRGNSLCPLCQVPYVTIRNSFISHVGAGLQIGNAMSDNGGAPLDGQRYSIHDIVIDDMDGTKYNGPSEFAQIYVSAGAPLLQNVAINHVTAFPGHMLFLIGDMVATSTPMKNFVFTNNIVNAGNAPYGPRAAGRETVLSTTILSLRSTLVLPALVLPPIQLSLLRRRRTGLRRTSSPLRRRRSDSPITMAALEVITACNPRALTKAKVQTARISEQMWMPSIRLPPALNSVSLR